MAEHKSSFIITAIFVAWIALIAGIYAWVSSEQAAIQARAAQEQAQTPPAADKPAK